jgi:2C-methyl-D-erythritol 2,4-cyclodiphosphate synthase
MGGVRPSFSTKETKMGDIGTKAVQDAIFGAVDNTIHKLKVFFKKKDKPSENTSEDDTKKE